MILRFYLKTAVFYMPLPEKSFLVQTVRRYNNGDGLLRRKANSQIE